MKKMKTSNLLIKEILIALIIITVSFNLKANGQNDGCRVLLHPINDTYEGSCKKGFAHGKGVAKGEDVYEGKFKMGLPHGSGTYTWANGNKYSGSWKKGKRDGIGTYYSASNGEEVKGIWKDDEFIKEYEGPSHKILYKSTSVEKIRIYEVKGAIPGTIEIEFRRDGYKNERIITPLLHSMSGMQEISNQFIGFKGAIFPFKANVKFQAPNRTNRILVNYTLDFEIYKEGAWKVIIYY